MCSTQIEIRKIILDTCIIEIINIISQDKEEIGEISLHISGQSRSVIQLCDGIPILYLVT